MLSVFSFCLTVYWYCFALSSKFFWQKVNVVLTFYPIILWQSFWSSDSITRDADFPFFPLFLARSVSCFLYFLLFHLSLSQLSVSFCVHFLWDGTHVDFQLFSQKSSDISVLLSLSVPCPLSISCRSACLSAFDCIYTRAPIFPRFHGFPRKWSFRIREERLEKHS